MCKTGLSSVFVFTILAFPQNPRTLCRRIPMLETPQLPVSIASPTWEDSAKHLAVEVYIFFGQTTLELSQNEVHRKINHAFPTFDGRKLEGIPPWSPMFVVLYPKLLHFLFLVVLMTRAKNATNTLQMSFKTFKTQHG